MNQSLDKALHYLTGKENIEAVTIEELETLINDHPYFTVLHLLLSKKLKHENDERFLQQVQKTALYFPNPYWLHYQLLNEVPDQPRVLETITENKDVLFDDVEKQPIFLEGRGTVADDIHPITTKFSPDEIETASNLAHQTLKEDHEFEAKTDAQESVKDEDLLPALLLDHEKETLPFNLDNQLSEPALEHANGVEGKVGSFNEIKEKLNDRGSAIPANVIEDDIHPITTKFSPDEIETASNLAHQTLREEQEVEEKTDAAEPLKDEDLLPALLVNPEKETLPSSLGNQVIELPLQHDDKVEEQVDRIDKTEEKSDFNGAEISSKINLAETHQAAFEARTDKDGLKDKAPEVSQPEEEMAAITRDTDETAEQFLEQLEEPISVDNDTKKVSDYGDVEGRDHAQATAGNLEIQPPKHVHGQIAENKTGETERSEKPDEIDEHEKMFQNIKAMLDASAEEANADTKGAVVPIDPYYTIDYFASQGIKLDLEKNPQDKLGKQVKKFTQWLKHMKKLGPEDALLTETISPAEVEAQKVADASNTAREVVTEAMALVLEKQGKKDKAIQLYRKLTFLNPHKSAYFADKIKNLNTT